MKRTTGIRSLDVPQPDSFSSIRRIVEAVEAGKKTVAEIGRQTAFSERHVRYRLQAARILGLLEGDLSIAARGQQLIKTPDGGYEELETFRDCVRTNQIVSTLAPTLLRKGEIDVADISKRIRELTELSAATADRRAVVLRAWHRQLVNSK